MPLYFAYGSNMDAAALRGRCPGARLVGPARLAGHRFVLMGRSGYASVRRDPRAHVHGILFDLALSDVPALDRYEDVARGLYTKAHQPVMLQPAAGEPGAARRALIYLGCDETHGGTPPAGYMQAIAAAARAAALPPAYIAMLETFLPRTAARRRPAARRPLP